MSLPFAAIPAFEYIGSLFAQPVKLAGISTSVVPCHFDWISYGASTALPDVAVKLNFQSANIRSLGEIRAAFIDNLNSSVPIYIYFPDTKYTVAAKPNSEGWYPVFTNGKEAWVIGKGFLTGSIPQTDIIFSNVAIPANVNAEIDNAVALWRASPVITRGTSIYNSALGIPALGDQFQQVALSMTAGAAQTLWGTPHSTGFIYLTSMSLNAFNISNTPATLVSVSLESTGVAGQLGQFFFVAPLPFINNSPPVFPIYSQNGLQIKLDATQTWRLRSLNSIAVGGVQFFSTFTKSD